MGKSKKRQKVASSSSHPSVSDSKPKSPSVLDSESQSANKDEQLDAKGEEYYFSNVVGLLSLSHEEKTQFFERMKNVVVMIQVYLPNGEACNGSGVVLKGGYILTCQHIFEGLNEEGIGILDCTDLLATAEVHHIDKKLDLALLKIIDDADVRGLDYHYAKLGIERPIEDGMQVFTIGHPDDFEFTYLSGHLCFPCKNPQQNDNPECRFSSIAWKDDVGVDFRTMDPNIPLLQINNFHVSAGCSGGPIFDACGAVIGVVVGFMYDSDFGVHIHALKKFLSDAKYQV